MAESTQNDEDRWSASPPAAAPAEAPATAVAVPKDSPLFADTTRVSVPNVPRRESAELRERTTDLGLGDPAGGSTKPFATYNPGGGQVSLLPPTAATRGLPAPNLRNPPSRPPAAPAAGIPGEHAGLRVAPPARPVPGSGLPSSVATLPPKPVSHPPPPPPPPASKPPPPPPAAVNAKGFFERASGEFGNAGGEHTPVVDGRLTKLPPPPIEAVPARPAAPSEPKTEAAPAPPTDIASLFGEELPPDPPPPGEGLTETSAELKITDDAEGVNASGEEGSASIQVNLDAPGPDAPPPAPFIAAQVGDPPVTNSVSDNEGPAVDPDPTAPITVAPPVPVRPLSSYLPALGLVAAMLAVTFGAASLVSRWLTLPSARRPTTTMVARPATQRPAPQPPAVAATCRSSTSFPSLEAAIAANYFPCRASHAAPPAFYCSIEAAPVAATRPRFCRSVRRACSSQNGSDACLANPLAARVAHDQRGAD